MTPRERATRTTSPPLGRWLPTSIRLTVGIADVGHMPCARDQPEDQPDMETAAQERNNSPRKGVYPATLSLVHFASPKSRGSSASSALADQENAL